MLFTPDYQKEFLNLLKDNIIKNLPSQELIDSNMEVALAVWKNYCPPSRYDAEEMNSLEIYNLGKYLL